MPRPSISGVSYGGRSARSAAGDEMRVTDRDELAPGYWKGSRRERGAILDAFCLATGYHRNYAVAMLTGRLLATG